MFAIDTLFLSTFPSDKNNPIKIPFSLLRTNLSGIKLYYFVAEYINPLLILSIPDLPLVALFKLAFFV